jgi:FKBP-type peptidyl-prolyl cis-trans isomerase
MIRLLFTLVPWLFFLVSCGGDRTNVPPAGAETGLPPAAEPENEEEWILRLSGELAANPRTQAERDRNAIVNYAIDSLLDVRSTPSGLFYQVLRAGEGEPLQWGDRIRVHYRGYFLENGRVFDSSYRRGKPMEFYIGNMIDGWNEGMQLLRPGAQALFLVPSGLAYGEKGVQNEDGETLVPPNAVLAFEVEVVEVTERRE